MKKILLMGKSGAGKTTLIQAIQNEEIEYRKTQALEFINNFVDSPGEFIEQKRFYSALLVTSYECDLIGLVQEATESESLFPRGLPVHLKNLLSA